MLVADTLYNIGNILSDHKSNEDRALEVYRDAFRLYSEKLGEDHMDVANTLECIGTILSKKTADQKCLDEAMQCFLMAMNVHQSACKEHGSEELATLNAKVADLHKANDNHQDAEKYYRAALGMHRPQSDSDDSHALTNLNLAETLLLLGNHRQSIPHFSSALPSLRKRHDPKTPETLFSLARAHFLCQNHDLSLEALEESKSLLPPPPLLARIDLLASMVHSDAGRADPAIAAAASAAGRFRSLSAADDALRADLQRGRALLLGRRHREAMDVFENGIVRKVRYDRERNGDVVAQALDGMAAIHRARQRIDLSILCHKEELRARSDGGKIQDEEVAHCLVKLGKAMAENREYERAVGCLEKAKMILQRSNKSEEDLREVEQVLERVRKERKDFASAVDRWSN